MISFSDHLSSRGLEWDTVAAKAGMSSDRLQEIAGGAAASLAELRKIAKAIRVPLSALVGGEDAEPIKMLFRQTLDQRESAVSSSLEVLSLQIRDALSIAHELPQSVDWLDLFRGLVPSVASAESFATIFRRAFAQLDDLEPFPHLPRVAEELGIHLLYSKDPSIEGVSAIIEGHAFILLAPRRYMPRVLFTIAHEIGHLVARHDRRSVSYAILDGAEQFDDSDEKSLRDDERFADTFASCLLLPRHGVLKAIDAFRRSTSASGPLGDIEILLLARFFSVSFEVAARRCEQLDLLPQRGARALYQKISDDFGNPERRADALGLPAREAIDVVTSPSLLKAASNQVNQGAMSAGRAAELLNVPVSALFVANAE